MPDREKVINALQQCVGYEDDDNKYTCIYDGDINPNCPYGGTGEYGVSCMTKMMRDALALLKEYDEALKLMVYQYCTMKPLTVHDEVFHNKFMSAGEAAFRLLELENGQSTDGVWERWFPNG